MISGKLPEKIFIALIADDAFIGSTNKSMLNYSSYELSEVALRINEEIIQNLVVPYEWQATDGTGVDDYVIALNNLKRMGPNGISMLSFKNGKFKTLYFNTFYNEVSSILPNFCVYIFRACHYCL